MGHVDAGEENGDPLGPKSSDTDAQRGEIPLLTPHFVSSTYILLPLSRQLLFSCTVHLCINNDDHTGVYFKRKVHCFLGYEMSTRGNTE